MANTVRSSDDGHVGDQMGYVLTGGQSAVGALTANGVGTCGADDNQGQAGHLLAIPAVSNTLCSNRGQRNDHNEQTYIPVAFSQNGSDVQATGDRTACLRGEGMSSGNGGINVAYSIYPESGQGADLRATEIDTATALTVNAMERSTDRGVQIVSSLAVRRLTPLECLRLQGLPDDWLDDLGLADSTKYRQVGNSVAVPVLEWIARRLIAAHHSH